MWLDKGLLEEMLFVMIWDLVKIESKYNVYYIWIDDLRVIVCFYEFCCFFFLEMKI